MCCLCACFKQNSGGLFSTKFILAPKVNLYTLSPPTRPCPIPKRNMCANRSDCVAFAHIKFSLLQELLSGDIVVQPTIVLEVINDIEKNWLAIYVQKRRVHAHIKLFSGYVTPQYITIPPRKKNRHISILQNDKMR